jgi:Ni/Co efflux regulator RcnB
MHKSLRLCLLCTALAVPMLARAQDRDEHRDAQEVRHYEDREHHDSHEWNEKEDQAYRRYLQERHKKYRDFSKASKKEQQAYWNWRHDHPE